MKLVNNFKKSIQDYFDKKKEDREYQEKLDREVRAEEKKIYAQEYRKNAFEVARLKAQRDAMNKSGLAKLRAVSQAQSSGKPKPSYLSKLSEYTRSNMARREENIKRTQAIRKAAMEERQKKISSGRRSLY